MSMKTEGFPPLNVRLLVRWLGVAGATTGLLDSKDCSLDVLTELANTLGVKVSKSASRKQLVEEIVKFANKRIEKSVEEMYQMSKDDLVSYLTEVEPSTDELLDILRVLETSPKKEGYRGLIELTARELSETGRFMQIAASKGRHPTQTD